MSRLIAPTIRLQDAWREAHADWGPGVHEDGFGLSPSDAIDSAAGFAAWIARLAEDRRRTFRWIVVGDPELSGERVLGGVIFECEGQHGRISFGIRPSARRPTLEQHWMLSRMLDEARGLGLHRVVITGPDDYRGWAWTMESHGGVLESAPEAGRQRYRVNVPVVVAEVLGMDWSPRDPSGLRFLHDPESGRWWVDLPPIYRVATTAAEVHAFALACRACLAAGPGEHDANVFFDDPDDGILGFEIEADGTLNLDLSMNLRGSVGMYATDYDRGHIERVAEVLLEVTT